MASCVKPCIGLDGELCRPIRGKGGGAIRKALSRRNGIVRAGGQSYRYILVSRICERYRLRGGGFRIAYCFTAKVQRSRGRGGIAGNGKCNRFKRAGVISQFGIVLFAAVVLLAEHI